MESNHNKKFDQQVKKKFEDFSVEAPPSLWTAIEKEIKSEEVKTNKVFNLKRYRFISAAAALLIIGFTIWKIQPEEKIFLSGQETEKEPGFVHVPEIKQSTNDKVISVMVEEDNEPVLKPVPKPISVAIAHEDSEGWLLRDPQLAVEQKIDEVSTREQLLAVSTPIENDNASIINNKSASSLNKTLDITSENLDSLYQEPYLVENEPEGRQKIVSSILNFVAANIQIGGDKRVQFTENEHGIIKIGLRK